MRAAMAIDWIAREKEKPGDHLRIKYKANEKPILATILIICIMESLYVMVECILD